MYTRIIDEMIREIETSKIIRSPKEFVDIVFLQRIGNKYFFTLTGLARIVTDSLKIAPTETLIFMEKLEEYEEKNFPMDKRGTNVFTIVPYKSKSQIKKDWINILEKFKKYLNETAKI